MEPVPNIVINQSVLCSLKISVQLLILKYLIQFKPLIMTPENIIARDQVAALKDSASVLLSVLVLRIINGSEHTRISIIQNPKIEMPIGSMELSGDGQTELLIHL